MPDALHAYRAKRNFSITPEPRPGADAHAGAMRFVIQKHWASRLHYDFRLEFDGALKSWAVPKGPSYDPAVKRMAVQVEDHPLEYADFEGNIPEGEYGGGKVIVWDKGHWQPLNDPHSGFERGELKFILHGHKLHGAWVLVRMKNKGEKQTAWLLIKEKDGFVKPEAQYSVVDALPDSVGNLPMPSDAPAATTTQGVTAALPPTLAPQLATLVEKAPLDASEWSFEVKFDGYRMLTRVEGESLQLWTRNGNDWTAKLPSLHAQLVALHLPDGWYDGEIVVHDEAGRPDFGLLQQAFDGQDTHDIVYFLFDLPFFDGRDLRDVPLERRRAILKSVLPENGGGAVRFSESFDGTPDDIVAAACQIGLEGIIGKRRDGAYVSRRSRDWIKLKCGQRQEFVIAGYTDPQGTRSGFGSLLLGYHDADGTLRYAGNVGSGFDERDLRELTPRLHQLRTETSPFPPNSVPGHKHHWVQPILVAEVGFAEWTRGGSIRHAVFHGLRSDKPSEQIERERAMPLPEQLPALAVKLPQSLKVTHPERMVDAQSGVTKIELLRYYALVGELMMLHLKQRPAALLRATQGVGGELFFQKHVDSDQMDGVRQLDRALDPDHPSMVEISNATGILSAAQWNVIEFHTQNARSTAYETPDRIVFDLDPGQGVDWRAMQTAALTVRGFLETIGLAAFLKTSGGKGLHIVVPLRPAHDWDTVKQFSQEVVRHLASTIPDRFAFKSGPRNRVGRIFVDYLRNGRGATTACAWSARARPGLGISVPLGWEELDAVHSGDQWSVRSAHTRLDQGNAPWSAYARSARKLDGPMRAIGMKTAE
jgi:bifunctional non-homologous end joining protein LigD